MEYILLLILLLIGVPFTKKTIKKYPCTVPEIFWKNLKRKEYKKKDFYISIGIFAGLIGLQYIPLLFHPTPLSFYILLFLGAILFLMKTDWDKQILPDFITVPFILLGIAVPFLTPNALLTPFDAILGAMIGYAMPSLLGFFTYPWKKEGLGAGDVKLLAMIGAWTGIIGLSYVIIFGTILFGIYSWKMKKRTLPLAPFMGLSTILFMALQPILFD
ncbi:MAG: prepilin peptidase [Alphaproteobacteria bacterium]|nr:prepilin peptidase [Alphaproteobacteria bacterium]MBN2779825.1 prepilin peptidase [Alphaproteobacteria bacterium]